MLKASKSAVVINLMRLCLILKKKLIFFVLHASVTSQYYPVQPFLRLTGSKFVNTLFNVLKFSFGIRSKSTYTNVMI